MTTDGATSSLHTHIYYAAVERRGGSGVERRGGSGVKAWRVRKQ